MSNSVESYIAALVTLKATKQAFAAIVERVADQRAKLEKWEGGQNINLANWPSEKDVATGLVAFQTALHEAKSAWEKLNGAPEQNVLKAPTEIDVEPAQKML